MGLLLFLRLFAVSLTGMLTALLAKNEGMAETTAKANLEYDGFWGFIKKDWKGIGLNLLAILATFLLFGGLVEAVTKWSLTKTYFIFGYDIPLKFVWYIFNGLLFYATGYFGQDFILRKVMKSVQNRMIKEAIDKKTTIADATMETLDVKTPLK